MRRIAFFVEGYSEVLFVEKLIREVAGRNNVVIERGYIKGGKTVPKQLTILGGTDQTSGSKFYVLILNCQGDKQVMTRISEEHAGFFQQGYEKIIGLRDVRPDFNYSDIPELGKTIGSILEKFPIPTEMVFSVMEIESVFLGEASHFSKISPNITTETIKKELGFDPENDDMELRAEPASDLNKCYALGGGEYLKYAVQDTVNALDFSRVHLELRDRFSAVARLVTNIDQFLAPAPGPYQK